MLRVTFRVLLRQPYTAGILTLMLQLPTIYSIDPGMIIDEQNGDTITHLAGKIYKHSCYCCRNRLLPSGCQCQWIRPISLFFDSLPVERRSWISIPCCSNYGLHTTQKPALDISISVFGAQPLELQSINSSVSFLVNIYLFYRKTLYRIERFYISVNGIDVFFLSQQSQVRS